MIKIELNVLLILQGIFTLFYVVIALIISLIIISKYFKQKRIEILLVGIALLGLSGPWIPDAATFIAILITGSNFNVSFYLSLTINITFLTTIIVPVSVISWLYVIMKFLNVNNRKIALILISILMVLFDASFSILFFINVNFVGNFIGPFNYQWSLFTSIFYLSITALIIITGILFTKESLRSQSPTIKLKGKFLSIALITFVIGVLIPYISIDISALIISRLTLIVSAIGFYVGFMLPKWVENLFIKG